MKDIEVITIDNKKYAILNEVEEANTTYVYLSNIDDEDEFYLATLLLFKGVEKKDGE